MAKQLKSISRSMTVNRITENLPADLNEHFRTILVEASWAILDAMQKAGIVPAIEVDEPETHLDDPLRKIVSDTGRRDDAPTA